MWSWAVYFIFKQLYWCLYALQNKEANKTSSQARHLTTIISKVTGMFNFYIISFEDLCQQIQRSKYRLTIWVKASVSDTEKNYCALNFLILRSSLRTRCQQVGLYWCNPPPPGKIRTSAPILISILKHVQRVFFSFLLKALLGFMSCHSWHDS